jgi:hypothetical protein
MGGKIGVVGLGAKSAQNRHLAAGSFCLTFDTTPMMIKRMSRKNAQIIGTNVGDALSCSVPKSLDRVVNFDSNSGIAQAMRRGRAKRCHWLEHLSTYGQSMGLLFTAFGLSVESFLADWLSFYSFWCGSLPRQSIRNFCAE